jgi:2-keto-4-pentenoate hydratase/2-oxohepta-3-ene-1,7-dioic acid hydratase in catechol pathway
MKFFVAYEDGLVETEGHEIQIGNRKYVVHKGRVPFDREYRVSDLETGFAVVIGKTRSKQIAIAKARAKLAGLTQVEIESAAAQHLALRAGLKVVSA